MASTTAVVLISSKGEFGRLQKSSEASRNSESGLGLGLEGNSKSIFCIFLLEFTCFAFFDSFSFIF